jgi:histidinol-phosphatase (PHP family)
MLDYHLHLWPHSDSSTWFRLEQVASYCDAARAAGVTQLALTEHLHRFTQVQPIVKRCLDEADDTPAVRDALGGYFDHHVRSDLDDYVELCLEAKAAGLPVVMGLEVDYFRGQMDDVATLLEGYPFDVLLGSVHWLGAWQFDDLRNPAHLAQWEVRGVDRAWEDYTRCMEELAATGTCDVLAHPDLIKIARRQPAAPEEWWDRIAEAAATSAMSAELSSSGWSKPVGEQFPARGLLERFVQRGVTLTTASDAHQLVRVADRMDDLQAMLDGLGVESLAAYDRRRRTSVPVTPR